MKNRCSQGTLFLLILISSALFGCGTGSGPSSITDSTTGKTLNLIWADEFKGSSLDMTKWNVETGYGNNGWGNDEWQLYTNSSNNVTVENGNLVITARCDSGDCGKRDGTTTSARITTQGKFYTKYGSIQARIKIPGGKGTWPAFWMLGTNQNIVGWPKCGEIDIMEVTKYDSADKTTHSTVHWYDQTVANGAAKGWTYFTGSKTFPDSLSNDYHVYEVDWNADRIIGKIDGVTYFTKVIDPATMEEFLRNFYLLFNVAVGGNLAEAPNSSGTSWPQKMYVDWVRVYGSAPFTPSSSADAGLFSETRTDPMVPYNRIINSADWSGNSAIPNQASTAVTAKEGTAVLSAQFLNDLGKGWNGIFFDFGSVSVTDFGSYFFSVDVSKFVNFKDITIEFKDTANNAGDVLLSRFTPTVSGNWATYQIPLKSIPSADLSTLAFLGYMNPKDASGVAIPGTLYFDDMYFGACTAPPSVKFATSSYSASAAKATVTVSEPCTGAAAKTVAISNGTTSISVNVTLNSTGTGSAPVNFGATNDTTDTIAVSTGTTLTASYTSSSSAVLTTTASITAPAIPVVVGDIAPKDGFVYLYATNPATVIDFVGGTNYTVIDNWGSGSTYNMAYADATYNPVMSIIPGGGWGVNASVLAYRGFTAGFASTYVTLHFKYKGAPQVTVNFSDSGTPAIAKENVYVVGSATALSNGWYQFDINMSDFPNRAVYKEFGIFYTGGVTPVYITDIYFD